MNKLEKYLEENKHLNFKCVVSKPMYNLFFIYLNIFDNIKCVECDDSIEEHSIKLIAIIPPKIINMDLALDEQPR